MDYIFQLIIIMFVAGSFGGLISYFIKSKEDEIIWPKSIAIGICAAFIVPLFLKMISSDLLVEKPDEPYRPLIFAGFCLIAAISSRKFINSMTDRLLKEVEKAKTDIKNIQNDVEPIINKATEQEAEEKEVNEVENDEKKVQFMPEPVHLEEVKNSILETLNNSNFTYRTIGGIAKDAGLSKGEVRGILTELVGTGLIKSIVRPKGLRWFLTDEGRKLLHNG